MKLSIQITVTDDHDYKPKASATATLDARALKSATVTELATTLAADVCEQMKQHPAQRPADEIPPPSVPGVRVSDDI